METRDAILKNVVKFALSTSFKWLARYPSRRTRRPRREKIRVTFIGNHPIDWLGPKPPSSITPPSAAQAPAAQSSVTKSSKPLTATSSLGSPPGSGSESLPKTNEEFKDKFAAYVDDTIKRFAASHDDPDADFVPADNSDKKWRADRAKNLVGLLAILRDPSSRIRPKVEFLDTDMKILECESFSDYLGVRCDTLAPQAGSLIEVWESHGSVKEVDEDPEEEDIEAKTDERNDPDPEIDEEDDPTASRKRKRTGKTLPMLLTTGPRYIRPCRG